MRCSIFESHFPFSTNSGNADIINQNPTLTLEEIFLHTELIESLDYPSPSPPLSSITIGSSTIPSVSGPSSAPDKLTPSIVPSTSRPATSFLPPVLTPTTGLHPLVDPLSLSGSPSTLASGSPGKGVVSSQFVGPGSYSPIVGPTQNPTSHGSPSGELAFVQLLNPLSPAPPLPELQCKQRSRHLPAKLNDYIFNTLKDSTPLLVNFALSPNPSMCSYRIGHYISSENFSPYHKDFVVAITVDTEPFRYTEALSIPYWRDIMRYEINALEWNQTWKITNLTPGL